MVFETTRRKQLYALALLLVALPLIDVRMNKQRTPRQRPQIPPGLSYLVNNSGADDVVLTDAPWLVAWYGERRAVWLPQRREDLELMRELGAEFDWVYIANVQPRDRREIGDWWGDLVVDPAGWEEFEAVEPRFRGEFVMRRTE